MKKLLTLILALSLVMSFSVCAEETEIEGESPEEAEKGSRLNPYELGEEMDLGKVYDGADYVDVKITFSEILDEDALQELYPDSTSMLDHFVMKGTLSTGEASNDDAEIPIDLDARIYTSDLSNDYNAYIEKASDARSLYDVYSYIDYDVICESSNYPKDKDYLRENAGYLRIACYTTAIDYDGDYDSEEYMDYYYDYYYEHEPDKYIWMSIK